jgi:2-methylcitrate dehydratase
MDGSVFDQVAVAYPIGHARRRVEGIPLLIEKYKTNLARIYDGEKQKKITDLCLDYDQLVATPVNEFMDLMSQA